MAVTEFQPLDLKEDNLGTLIDKISDNLEYLRTNMATQAGIDELKELITDLEDKIDKLPAGGTGGSGEGCPCCPYLESLKGESANQG